MPKPGTTIETNDPKWRMERCLNCTLPAKYCRGNAKCFAQQLMEKDAMYQSVIYARKKGMRIMDIAGTLHVSEATVKSILQGRSLKLEKT